ncbi:hypothetical protein BASA81_002037 [Batrachochytrium salamandrivorans]|nr:hypothetical protein BASA81_002037 [Batrachochytrium salamandrivorans]
MCRPTKRPKPATQIESPALFSESDVFDFKFPTKEQQSAVETESTQVQISLAPVSAPPPASKQTFVFTTYEMVSDSANAKAVGFDSTGTLIQIRDATLFGEQILPKYFRHRNVTSFYRQLNSYGFRTIKTSSVDVSHTFVCDMFRRDRPDLLPTIVRKKASPPPPALAAAQQQYKQRVAVVSPLAAVSAPVAMPTLAVNNDASVMRMIQELKDFQRNQQTRALQLEENIRRLSSENSKILREGEQVISNMQGMVLNQKTVIQQLFGSKASEAFEAQLMAEPMFPAVASPVYQDGQAPLSPLDMDLFGLEVSSSAVGSEEFKFALPDDDLLELETLLAFEDDGFSLC